jgi:hypothetical protein
MQLIFLLCKGKKLAEATVTAVGPRLLLVSAESKYTWKHEYTAQTRRSDRHGGRTPFLVSLHVRARPLTDIVDYDRDKSARANEIFNDILNLRDSLAEPDSQTTPMPVWKLEPEQGHGIASLPCRSEVEVACLPHSSPPPRILGGWPKRERRRRPLCTCWLHSTGGAPTRNRCRHAEAQPLTADLAALHDA